MDRTVKEKERNKDLKKAAGREEEGMESECWRERGVSVLSHTLWIKLEASEIDINFNREIPLRWAWCSATALDWHRGGECGWGDGKA